MRDPEVTDDVPADVVEDRRPRRGRRRWRRTAIVSAILLLLFGVPWWTLLLAGTAWPAPVVVGGTLLFAAAFVALPAMLFSGHRPGRGRRRPDWVAATADALLGVAWVLFVWSVLGNVLRLVLLAAGVDDPLRGRVVAVAVAAVALVLLVWGYAEAMRVPRTRTVEIHIPGLGRGLDGLRVAMITDTHYGPIDRARWSAAVVDRVNSLDADIVCHVGDIADGTVADRERQASPLAAVTATSARVYVTGNHEYFSEAQGWLDYMERIGWDALHSRHLVVERGGDRLVVAGVDDATAKASGCAGTAPTSTPHSPVRTAPCRFCCWPISPNRSPTPPAPGWTCRSPGTPTAARSGRSTSWCGWSSRWCRDSAATERRPSSTPAAAPDSGGRRSGCSRPARSRC